MKKIIVDVQNLNSEDYQISKTGKTVEVFRDDISGKYKVLDGGYCKYIEVSDSIGQTVQFKLI